MFGNKMFINNLYPLLAGTRRSLVGGELSPQHPTPFVVWCGNSGSADIHPPPPDRKRLAHK